MEKLFAYPKFKDKGVNDTSDHSYEIKNVPSIFEKVLPDGQNRELVQIDLEAHCNLNYFNFERIFMGKF